MIIYYVRYKPKLFPLFLNFDIQIPQPVYICTKKSSLVNVVCVLHTWMKKRHPLSSFGTPILKYSTSNDVIMKATTAYV